MTCSLKLQTAQRQLLFALVAVITLAAGLHPKEFRFRNSVERTEDAAGLHFVKYGVAYTDPILDVTTVEQLNLNGFELALSLGGQTKEQRGFAFIAQIHSGDPATQFIVGRYADHLIVMYGDDYRHRFKRPRISTVLTKSQRTDGVTIVIRSDQNGSSIKLDGVVVAQNDGVRFQIPHSPKDTRIVLGNSVYGAHSWEGELREFALSEAGRMNDPILSYSMNNILDEAVPNNGSAVGDLRIPQRFPVVERNFLAWPFNHQFETSSSFFNDVLLNLFGFTPFGFVVGILLLYRSKIKLIGLSILGSAAMSLCIEYAQTWMPSRSSSLLDLLLNIGGGFLGVILLVALIRYPKRNLRSSQIQG